MNGFFLYPRHPTSLSFKLVDVLLYHGAYTTLREAIYLKLGKHKYSIVQKKCKRNASKFARGHKEL